MYAQSKEMITRECIKAHTQRFVQLQTCSFDSLTIDINKDFDIAKMASLNSQSSVTNKKYRFGGMNVWTLLKFDSSIGSRVEGL